MWVCMGPQRAYICFCMQRPEVSWGFFISYSLSCFWLGSLTGFGEAGPGDPRDVPASVQLQAHTIASSFLNVCWRTKLKTSCLCRQHFTDWAFPNPRIQFDNDLNIIFLSILGTHMSDAFQMMQHLSWGACCFSCGLLLVESSAIREESGVQRWSQTLYQVLLDTMPSFYTANIYPCPLCFPVMQFID